MKPHLVDHLRKSSVSDAFSGKASILPDETLNEATAAEKLACRWSVKTETEATRKAKKSRRTSIFGDVFKKKELSEEEIRRRMAMLGAGDGAGRGAAW